MKIVTPHTTILQYKPCDPQEDIIDKIFIEKCIPATDQCLSIFASVCVSVCLCIHPEAIDNCSSNWLVLFGFSMQYYNGHSYPQ